MLNILKHHMNRRSAQELLKLLVSSLRSHEGNQRSLPTIVFDMLEMLLCSGVGDHILDTGIVGDLLHAMTQDKHGRLDALVLSLLSERDKYGIAFASDEVHCPVHGTGHHLSLQRAVGSCDLCALATLDATLKAVLPTAEAKNLVCSDELLHALRAWAAPRLSCGVSVSMQKSIMKCCLESLDGVRAKIASLLLLRSSAAFEMFKGEEGWCERLCQAVVGSEGDLCHGQLLVVGSYLNLAASRDLGIGLAVVCVGLHVEGCFGTVGCSSDLLSNVARKRLWKRCLGLLSDPLCSQEHMVGDSWFLGAFWLEPFLSNSTLAGML